jgi:hypothetical protein
VLDSSFFVVAADLASAGTLLYSSVADAETKRLKSLKALAAKDANRPSRV